VSELDIRLEAREAGRADMHAEVMGYLDYVLQRAIRGGANTTEIMTLRAVRRGVAEMMAGPSGEEAPNE